MIFLHLSDIHFHSWSGSKLDIDEDLRLELLSDAEQVAGKLGPPAGVLVTGDIAFAGTADDYLHAKEWLAKLCARVGRTIEIVWSVPGNHDVDRTCVSKSILLRDQHSNLRNVHVNDLDGQLAGYLRDPEAKDILFRPISEYNRFAGAFGCTINGDNPCWSSEDFVLNDGSALRITGLNSTVVVLSYPLRNSVKPYLQLLRRKRVAVGPAIPGGELFWTLASPPRAIGAVSRRTCWQNVRVGKAANLQIGASGRTQASVWRRTTAARSESPRSSL